MQKAGDLEQN